MYQNFITRLFKNLRLIDLHGADLRGADLHGADLHGADLQWADLHGANLHGANLHGVDLRGADLRGANLRGADLRGADLRGANLRVEDLRNCIGNGLEITTLQNYWTIIICGDVMAIGCQQHLISEWFDFEDSTISDMDPLALSWWKVWKPVLKAYIEALKP